MPEDIQSLHTEDDVSVFLGRMLGGSEFQASGILTSARYSRSAHPSSLTIGSSPEPDGNLKQLLEHTARSRQQARLVQPQVVGVCDVCPECPRFLC